ncbi:MAG: response regulator, partial [Erysipelotrichaceae bacterium]
MYHIAIVEDNKKIRDELSDFLNKNGYKTSTPHNFENIIDEIKTLKPHLLLLDLNLPMVDGHQICREIRKISTMPIIIV